MFMKKVYLMMSLVLSLGLFCACSNDDDTPAIDSPTALYAVIKREGAQLIDIMPSDYVLTLDNIIAVNPETGEFKMKDTERIDSKAFPTPTQYVIMFFSEDSFLFEAKLNSSLSSTLSTGVTFCHFLSDKNGLARYDLSATRLIDYDGSVDGDPTDQQRQGIQRMYQILQKAGKTSSNITYDFQFK